MTHIHEDNHYTIGETPLAHLSHFCHETHNVFAKVESRNPLASVKDRAAMGMILEGEKSGALHKGGAIVEATSGNMGIALAWISKKRGYRCIFTMPETMSIERRAILEYLGAELVLTEGAKGMKGAIAKAKEIAKENNAYCPNQFANPGNPGYHYKTTGPEIWEQSHGEVSMFVAGVGTGGTLSGVGKFLKEKNPAIKIIAVEPADSPVLSAGEEHAGPHKIQGIGPGFIPENLDTNLIDGVITIETQDAYEASREIGRKEGLFVGTSAGANAWAARELALQNPHETIVTVLCDTAERYLSTPLFDI